MGLVPRNLKTVGRGRRDLFGLPTLCQGPSGPDNKGEGNEYAAYSVPENGCLPYKVVLVMPATVPGVRSREYRSHMQIM